MYITYIDTTRQNSQCWSYKKCWSYRRSSNSMVWAGIFFAPLTGERRRRQRARRPQVPSLLRNTYLRFLADTPVRRCNPRGLANSIRAPTSSTSRTVRVPRSFFHLRRSHTKAAASFLSAHVIHTFLPSNSLGLAATWTAWRRRTDWAERSSQQIPLQLPTYGAPSPVLHLLLYKVTSYNLISFVHSPIAAMPPIAEIANVITPVHRLRTKKLKMLARSEEKVRAS